MRKLFEDLGYHLDVLDPITKKYIGSIPIEKGIVPEDAPVCYASRKLEKLNHYAKKGTKTFHVKGEYLTELVPLCGKKI